MVKLWIDDVRPAPEGWLWVKSYDEAVEAFERDVITDASIYFDLGYVLPEDKCHFDVSQAIHVSAYDDNLPTGGDLMRWVAKNEKWPSVSCAVHSMNPSGAKTMIGLIERYGPYANRESIIYHGPDSYKLYGVRYS